MYRYSTILWMLALAVTLTACDSAEEDPFEDDNTTGIVADGNVRIILKPQSVGINDDIQNDKEAYLFLEKGGLALERNLRVDITQPGLYLSNKDLTTGVIEQGTRINSYYIDYDPQRRIASLKTQITFPYEVLGVIARTNSLDNTDAQLADTTINYSQGSDRGFDFVEASSDSLRFATDRRTLMISFDVDGQADQLRVITRSE